SLAYRCGPEWAASTSRDFRFVVIDEAFGRGSDESTRYALDLFAKLGLQLLIVTPLQKVHVIEPSTPSGTWTTPAAPDPACIPSPSRNTGNAGQGCREPRDKLDHSCGHPHPVAPPVAQRRVAQALVGERAFRRDRVPPARPECPGLGRSPRSRPRVGGGGSASERTRASVRRRRYAGRWAPLGADDDSRSRAHRRLRPGLAPVGRSRRRPALSGTSRYHARP